MPINRSQALLAALVLAAAPAFAQESTTPSPSPTPAPAEAPATEAAQTPAPAADAAAAPAADATAAPATAPANAEPQVGQYYVKSTNDAWTTRCIKAEQGKDPCELYQLLKDGEGNSVAEMTVIPLKNSDVAAGSTLIAPLETDLIQGLGLAVGDAEPRGYPFSFCAQVGCVSRMGFTQAELDALKRGKDATLTLLPFGGDREKPVRLTLSLAGFTAAFDALSTYAAEPAPAAQPAPATDAPAAPAN